MRKINLTFPSLLILMLMLYNNGFSAGFDNSLARFSNTTTYIDVNRNNFLTNITVGTQQQKDFANYHYSTLKLGVEIAKIFNNETPYNTTNYDMGATAFNILDFNNQPKFRAYRLEYTEQINFNFPLFLPPPLQFISIGNFVGSTRLRAVIIRPTGNAVTPCVFVASGAGAELDKFPANYITGVNDLLLKGYTVVLYETLASGRNINFIKTQDNSQHTNSIALASTACLATVTNANSKINITQQTFYLTSRAIAQVVCENNVANNILNINTNQLYTLGFSAGNLPSQMLLLARPVDFPTPFAACGITPNNNFTVPAFQNTTYNFNGGINVGGTFFKVTGAYNGVINILDNTDANKRMLLLFGQADNSPAYPFTGAGDYDSYLTASSRLNSINLRHYIAPICGAPHTLFFSPNGTAEDFMKTTNFTSLLTTFKNTPASTLVSTTIDNNTVFKDFKKINTQAFQIGNNYSKFIQNTINNTPTVMGTISTSNGVIGFQKNNGVIATPFTAESDWLYLGPFTSCTATVTDPNLRQSNPNPTKETKATNLPMMFPNPTTGKLNINLKLDNDVNGYSVSIFSVDGRSIINNTNSEKLEAGSVISKEFDISAQPNGVYFIRITSENNVLLNKTFILNK